ncbi:MAG TPA: leucine-rich repeat domain-containing protein [Bacteroidia bacterium]|nr:leucine-rich repeat domain-containing protein [Bacteroidia bacterium]
MRPLSLILVLLFGLRSFAQNEFDQYGPFGAAVYTDLKDVGGLENQVYKLDLNYKVLDNKALSRIQNLNNLQVLRMRNNGINRYPDNMEKLQNLVYFASYNNAFTSFLPKPESYRSLHYIELQHCKIDSIPASIAYLRLLTTFKFGNTDDSLKLPSSLQYLKKLKSLSFENCILDSMPKQLFRIQGLQFLSLSNTGTKYLSSHFERLPELEVLIVENNPLTSLPFDIYKAQKLRIISLRSDKISKIPDSISQLENLSILDLRGNPIEADEVEKLRALLPGCEIKF